MDAVDSSENGSRKLGPEGIPNAVFDLRRCAILTWGPFYRDELLAVHSLHFHSDRAVGGMGWKVPIVIRRECDVWLTQKVLQKTAVLEACF